MIRIVQNGVKLFSGVAPWLHRAYVLSEDASDELILMFIQLSSRWNFVKGQGIQAWLNS